MLNQTSENHCHHAGVGMVKGTMQQMHEIYPTQTALRRGTLYPELDKPMACAQNTTGCAQATSLQETAFCAWEIRLYLNTHPEDGAAVQFFQQLCQRMGASSYACAFLPCQTGGHWSWTDDPWPWELCANEGRA